MKLSVEDINSINPKYKLSLCLSQAQTASILNVSPSSLENWRKTGLGPEYKKIEAGKRGRILYSKVSIVEWLSQTVKTI